MKILAQIAPLTALLLGLALSGVGCVSSPADDASAVQADDPTQTPPWQGGPSAPQPAPSMGGVVGVGAPPPPPYWASGEGVTAPSFGVGQGDGNGHYGIWPTAGAGDDWQWGHYPIWSGQGQGYGGRGFEFPPSYGMTDGPWQGPVSSTAGNGGGGSHPHH
jgi:hypothetical protein